MAACRICKKNYLHKELNNDLKCRECQINAKDDVSEPNNDISKETEYKYIHSKNSSQELKCKYIDKGNHEVSIVDIDMPFSSMVIFMVKWAFAVIPAFIILSVIGGILFSLGIGIIRS